MAHEAGDFNQTLAAAAGDDAALMAELRAGFVESLSEQVDLLKRARCDGNWDVAARRLRGLGASFHATELVRLAEIAMESAPGDPVAIRKLESYRLSFDEPEE